MKISQITNYELVLSVRIVSRREAEVLRINNYLLLDAIVAELNCRLL